MRTIVQTIDFFEFALMVKSLVIPSRAKAHIGFRRLCAALEAPLFHGCADSCGYRTSEATSSTAEADPFRNDREVCF
jgi:hypothetical protein